MTCLADAAHVREPAVRQPQRGKSSHESVEEHRCGDRVDVDSHRTVLLARDDELAQPLITSPLRHPPCRPPTRAEGKMEPHMTRSARWSGVTTVDPTSVDARRRVRTDSTRDLVRSGRCQAQPRADLELRRQSIARATEELLSGRIPRSPARPAQERGGQ